MNVLRALGALLLAGLAAACAKGPERIEIVGPPTAGTAAVSDRAGAYASDLAAIMSAFEQALGLPRTDAVLVLFPNRRSFERGLLEVGYTPALARSASSFNAIGGARAVLVNGAVIRSFDRTRRVRLFAHELVHSLQYQFGGGTRGASEQWLREGFAEWVACRVTAHLGLAPFDALRDDLLADLAGAPMALAAAPFDALVTFPQWVNAQRRYEAPLYVQAFVAAELLIELRGVPAMVSYFEQFKRGSGRERAFAEAFRLDRAEFDRLFARRWREIVMRAAAAS